MKRLKYLLLLAATVAAQAGAVPIVFTGSSGTLAASVSFDIVGGQLVVVLTNTSTSDTLIPVDLLTAIFFTVSGNPALSRTSAAMTPGSTTDIGTGPGASDPGGVVGGEWAYLNGLSQYGANEGISSSGLGIFGPGNVFPGTNLDGPVDPDGPQYGLASAGDNKATGNPAILATPITHNSVTFTLGNIGSLTLANISNVTFQYGTALDEGHIPGIPQLPGKIPEPASIALLGMGLLAFGASRRKHKA